MTGRIVSPEEARTLREAASPGPWVDDVEWAAIGAGSDSVVHGYVDTACQSCGEEVKEDAEVALSPEDAALIAAAPDLAFTVEHQAKQIAAVEKWIRRYAFIAHGFSDPHIRATVNGVVADLREALGVEP